MNTTRQDTIEKPTTQSNFFPTAVYRFELLEHLDIVRSVGIESLNRMRSIQNMEELYPLLQSENIHGDERVAEFSQQVIQIAWDVLNSQGYAMENLTTVYESMWVQEHHKFSGMEQHTHGNGVQLVGFYFLDVPDDSSKLVFYDPRPAKVQINLPEKNIVDLTPASQAINFSPKEGELYFCNSWLPHAFTRHGNEKPLNFVHINVNVRQSHGNAPQAATVI